MGSRVTRFINALPFFKPDPEDEELKIVSRAEWRARVPKWREDLVYPALSSTTVYTGTPPCNSPEECTRAIQDLQATHMDQDGLPDIEYSFLVGGDGKVYEGRGWHTLSNRSTLVKCVDPEYPPPPTVMNKDKLKWSPDRQIVIAFIGDEKKKEATEIMVNAAKALVDYGINYFLIYSDEDDEDVKKEHFMKGYIEMNKREGKEGKTKDGNEYEDSDDDY